MRSAVLIMLLVFFALGCLSDTPPLKKGRVLVSGATIDVEIAKTPEELSRGLMNRATLPENGGMLFVFSDSAPRAFWMKNTLIPLDIIFISSDTKITNIEHALPCKADPCPLYRSRGNAMYVLEVNGGFSQTHGISEGDDVGLSY